MRAYSEDLRRKIVSAIERGMPKAQTARLFDVSLSSVKRYARTASQGGSLEPAKSPGRPHKVDEKAKVLLEKDVEERPTATKPCYPQKDRRLTFFFIFIITFFSWR
jgi:transposase